MANTFKTKIVSMGRITIPIEIRRALGLKEGDMVEVNDLRKLILVEAS